MRVIAKTPFRYKGKRIAEGAEVDVTDEFLKGWSDLVDKPLSNAEAKAKAAEEAKAKAKAEAEAKAKEEAEAKAKAEENKNNGK